MHKSERLPTATKLAYGAGEMGPAMAGSTMIFFLLVFLTNVAGLPAAMAGSVLMVGKLWDMINDPLIGWLSDNTKSKWGRRIPWMVYSAVPYAICFFLLWIVPEFSDDSERNTTMLFWYYVVIALLANAIFSMVSLPYASMTAELTHDYDERTRLNGYRQAFALGGSVGGLVIGLLVFHFVKGDDKVQYAVYGAVISVVTLASLGWCIGGIWKTAMQRESERLLRTKAAIQMSVWKQFGVVFQNKAFLIVCIIYFCSWLAVQFTASILPMYVKYCIGLGDTHFFGVAITVQGAALLMLPLWAKISVRVGKKGTYMMGMVFWLGAQTGLVFLPEGSLVLVYILALLAAFGVSVAYLIPFSMLPDVIELDELQTGDRREGVFYGFVVLLQKMGLALGQFLLGIALSAAGYISTKGNVGDVVQPESAITAIRLAIGPLPAVMLLIGIYFAWLYPISKARHAEIVAELEKRKAAL